jgi:hypothetical protein
MKKLIGIIGFIIIIVFILLYFFIPTTKSFYYQTTANVTPTAVTRKIIHKNEWQSWWPGEKINDTIYRFKNETFKINKVLLDAIEATIINDKDSIEGYLQFTGFGEDSTQFIWASEYHFATSPFKRFKDYFQLKKVNSDIKILVDSIQKRFDNPVNIYGMDIKEQKVTDSTLISLRNTFSHYPTAGEIYGMVDSINLYISKNGGEVNNYPMLNVHQNGPSLYETMVAIPAKKDVVAKGNFELKKMVLGNILMGEVKGGVHAVVNGEQQLRYYANDYHKMSPAMPFQSLVTNRIVEPDSTKWITRLYYPVFY